MAPWTTTSRHSKRNRRDSGSGKSKINSNNFGANGDFDDNNDGNKPSPFSKGFSLVPTITLHVTSTVTATTVQTSLVLQTMVVESDKNTTSGSFDPSTTSASLTSSAPGIAMPLNTNLGSTSPPSATMPIPVASIISIILSGLFFMTLCLVIYVRNPTFPSRILRMLKGNYRRQPPPTISSFEPKEYRGFSTNDGFQESFRSYLALARQSAASSEVSAAASSPSRARIILSADSSHGYSPKKAGSRGSASVISQQSVAQDKDANEEKRSSPSSASDFEYPFESDEEVSRLSVKRTTTQTSENAKFPQDVDEMTLDSIRVGGRSSL